MRSNFNNLADLNISHHIQLAEYNAIEQALRIHLDALDNIVTEYVQEPDAGADAVYQYPTRCAYVRDATNAIPLDQRFPPDHKDLLAINAFMRGLNVVKAIAYTINKTESLQRQQAQAQQALQNTLQHYYEQVFNTAPDRETKKYFADLEATFHTELLKILTSLELTQGIAHPDDFIGLLEHYRNCASLLKPASSFVTKHKHTTALGDIVYIDSAHPITKKTPVQLEQIALMSTLTTAGTPTNFHSITARAIQQVSIVFAPLLMRDNTALGAQTRSTTAPTAKNAFVVHIQILFPDGTTTDMFALRSASLAYIGNGETNASCVNYAAENFKQLMAAAHEMTGRINMHLTLLLTNHFINKQSTMVAISRTAAEDNDVSLSVLPINLLGVSHPLEIAPEVQALANRIGVTLPSLTSDWMNLFNKRLRTENVASLIKMISTDPLALAIPIITCASGQDRTGTIVEILTILWTVDELTKQGITVSAAQVAEARAVGAHNATHTVPGSAGLKSDSIPGYFSDLITKFYYRATAETNKHPKIDHAGVTKILGKTQPFTKEQLMVNFDENCQKISQASDLNNMRDALSQWANAVLHYQNQKTDEGILGYIYGVFRYFGKGTTTEQGLQIRECIVQIAQAFANNKNLDEASFSVLMGQIDVQIKDVTKEYTPEQRGSVFADIEKIMALTTKKLQQIQGVAPSVSNDSQPSVASPRN
jgi:hypothetical protein